MAIGRGMKRTLRGNNKKTDNEWSNHSKSMRSAGGSSETSATSATSAIKRVTRSGAAVPTTSTSIARSGYAKKLRTQEVRGKSQISYKKPNTTTLSTPTMSNRISRAVEKRDYATPESNIGRKTRNKMITRRYGR